MKFLKKQPVVSMILGALILIYAVLTRVVDHKIFNVDKNLGLIIIGLILLVFAIFVVLQPIINKKLKGGAFIVIAIQFGLLVYGAFSGFLLPAFNVSVPQIPYLSSGSHWFGFGLLSYGAINIVLDTYGKLSYKKVLVYLNLLFVILGVIIYERNLVDNHIGWITFGSMIIFGLLLLLIGLFSKKKR